jgi:tetratricopeptide (TPR) repeat protein
MQENEEFSEEDIKSYMDTFNVSREKAIKGLKQSYKDYKSEMGEGKKPFPDLTGDGKVTKADILKGRGVDIKEGFNDESLALTFRNKDEFERAKEHFEINSEFHPFDINDEFKTFFFQVEDQSEADVTEFYLTQELEGETNLYSYFFSMEPSPLSEDLDLGHEDNEPHMIKAELYRIGKYAMELYQMVDGFEGKGEVDFPAWWQSKITKAQEMMVSAKHYLDFELKEPAIDAMVGVASAEDMIDNEEPLMEDEIDKADILSGKLYKLKGKIQDAYFDKIRKWINMGNYQEAEELINRIKGQMKEKGLAETIAKKLKSN